MVCRIVFLDFHLKVSINDCLAFLKQALFILNSNLFSVDRPNTILSLVMLAVVLKLITNVCVVPYVKLKITFFIDFQLYHGTAEQKMV